MIVIVRLFPVKVAVQDGGRRLSRMGVIPRVFAMMLQLMSRQTDSDRGPQSPADEAGDGCPSASRLIHRAILEEPRRSVNQSRRGRYELPLGLQPSAKQWQRGVAKR